jgi:hypothetical protein
LVAEPILSQTNKKRLMRTPTIWSLSQRSASHRLIFLITEAEDAHGAGTPFYSFASKDRLLLGAGQERTPKSRSYTKICPSSLPAPPPVGATTGKTPLLTLMATALHTFLNRTV